MRWLTGTATATGQISTLKDVVRVIEFHAGADNVGKVRVGTTGVITSNGRALEAGESVTVTFSDDGSILFSEVNVAFTQSGDEVDWSIVVT